MKAIVRVNPGTMDAWKPYDMVSCKSYENEEEAKKQEELNGLSKVVTMIPDEDYEYWQKYLRKYRITHWNLVAKQCSPN